MSKERFINIFGELPTFHKFIYQSQKDMKTILKSTVLLNVGPSNEEVFIICDLYRQTNPPLLSPHLIFKRHCNNNNSFVIDTMVQFEPDNDMRKYILDNFHILSVPRKRKEESLMAKLRYRQQWQIECELLNEEQTLAIRNRVAYESYDLNSEDKVYLGFTAYIHDRNMNRKIKYTKTEFSSAVYDCNNSVILYPFHGSKAGGSVHILNMGTSISTNILIQLFDNSGWLDLAANVMVLGDRIQFNVPPYNGMWHDEDDMRLVHIKVLIDDHETCKKSIKFLYKR